MRSTNKRTQRATAITLVAALSVAVYLNWEYAQTGVEPGTDNTAAAVDVAADADPGDIALDVMSDQASQPVSDGLITEQEALETGDKNYGEAQLVSVSKDSGAVFFEQARLDRTKTRDTMIDDIEKSLKRSSLTQQEKQTLTEQMTTYLGDVTTENQIETLIKAKGFADCLCFLQKGKADLTVMTATGEGLNAAQVAQIRDIVLSQCNTLQAQDITVVEVK